MRLELCNIVATYGAIQALGGVSCEISERDLCLVLGRNGSGKSTLLKCICGQIVPSSGRIILDNCDVTGKPPWWHLMSCRTGKRVALSLQGRRLFKALTVIENLLLGGYMETNRQQLRDRLAYVLELFPMLSNRQRAIAGILSGGEQQQLALGRALMTGADWLLLDEPLLGLDDAARLTITDVIRRLPSDSKTVVMTEHNYGALQPYCSKTISLEMGRIALPDATDELRG